MKVSQFFLITQKETPADAELISHQLMLRAGMIRKLGAGLYTWLPLGWRVLRNIETIVREEMDRSGALELLMPAVQPAELWQETNRWNDFGDQLLKIRDRGERDYCFGPTHEEVVTDIMRREIKSYRQLPINFYQIQTKFRDEIRPRFGVMRAREFLMKDAYSFDIDPDSLDTIYQTMYQTYIRIFDRIGLNYRAVLADTGAIGGKQSHEFQVLSDSGEDIICYSDTSDYAANIELAEAVSPTATSQEPVEAIKKIATPQQRSVAEVCEYLDILHQQMMKILIVHGSKTPLIAIALRGDHELNTIKAEKHPLIATPLTFAHPQMIQDEIGCEPGSIGPAELPIPVIADRSAANMADFYCGANETHHHYQHVFWQRDAQYTDIADLRNVIPGDPSPDGQGNLKFCRGIEVGHIFQLGDKYSRAMSATVLDTQGKAQYLQMGCYGLGVSRVVAASIEQNHDKHGIIWPDNIAPFQIVIVPIKLHRSQRLREAVEALYQQLIDADFSVLLDDRNERPGVMFADMDLIGIPHRLVISERGLDENTIEYKHRATAKTENLTIDNLINILKKKITT